MSAWYGLRQGDRSALWEHANRSANRSIAAEDLMDQESRDFWTQTDKDVAACLDSDDSLSSSPIQLPLPQLPGQRLQAREGISRVPAEFDFGSSPSQFTAPSQARRTPSPPVPSLVSGNPTLSEVWHDERTPTAPHQPSESSYYTALWGSPYERPPVSLAGSKRTRPSQRRGTFSTEDSPARRFQRRGFVRSASASSHGDIPEEDEQDRLQPPPDFGTSRFRGKRTEDWLRAHIAHRRRGEKQNWWSDESGEGSGADEADTKPRKRRGRKSEFDDTWLQLREDNSQPVSEAGPSQQSSLRRPPRRILSSRFHRAAPSDATLTQAQFDDLVAGDFDDLPDINMLAAMSQGIQGMIERRGGSRSQSRDLSNMDKPLPPAPLERTASEGPIIEAKSDAPGPGSRPALSSTQSFLRPKKKVGWRGKTCVIALPLEDGKDENGNRKRYLSSSETANLMRKWEDRGYNTRGFDLIDDQDTYAGVNGQSAGVFEWATEKEDVDKSRNFAVSIPNRATWENYVKELQEEKLRALGVLKDKPEVSARQSPAPSLAQMSRQPSSQNSRAPTSIPNTMGSSVNGFRGPLGEGTFSPASFTSPDGHDPRQSMISPPTHTGGFHAPKQSIAFIPGQGFVNMQFPQPQPTPPPMLGHRHMLSSQPSSRGPSPAIVDGRRMSILTPQPPVISNQGNESALLRQQQHQLQQSMMQARRPDLQRAISGRTDDLNAPAVYSQPAQIASPMPQGHSHRHNVSESLQREIDEAEYHLEESIRKQLEDDDEQPRKIAQAAPTKSPLLDTQMDRSAPNAQRIEADLQTNPSLANSPSPGPSPQPVLQAPPPKPKPAPSISHAKKASTSKLRADVPEFVFDPTKSFKPSGMFNFGQPAAPPVQPQPQVSAFQFGRPTPGHSKNSSITSNLNVAAPAFVPGGNHNMKFQIPSEQSTDFSFSSSVPGIKPNAAPFKPGSSVGSTGSGPTSEAGSTRPHSRMFSHFNLDDIVRPERKSKAIPIVKPKTPTQEERAQAEAGDIPEDNEGRPTRDDARSKKARKGGDDGDSIPQFATPTPEPAPREQLRIAQEQIKAATPEPFASPSPDPMRREQLRVVQEQSKAATPEPKSRSLPTPPAEQPTNAASIVESVEREQPETVKSDEAITEKAIAPDAASSEIKAPTIQIKQEQSPEGLIELAQTPSPAPPIPEAAKEGTSSTRTPPSPSAQLISDLRMPKVDTEVSSAAPERKDSIIDWAETPLEGPYSRESLEAALNKRREPSIVEEPQEKVKTPPPTQNGIRAVESHAPKVLAPQMDTKAVEIKAPEPPAPKAVSKAIEIRAPETESSNVAPEKPVHVNGSAITRTAESSSVEQSSSVNVRANQEESTLTTPGSTTQPPKSSPSPKPSAFNPAAAAFNFNPAASTFNFAQPATSAFTFGEPAQPAQPAQALGKTLAPATSKRKSLSTEPEVAALDAAPEQEWPEKRERIKAPPKLGLERKTSGAKGGLGGGLLGTSRWAQAAETAPAAPAPAPAPAKTVAKESPKLPARENSPPASRGRKNKATREPSPPPTLQSKASPRAPSPEYREARKGFHFTTFGDKLAAARKAEPPREPSPPVRGRGKKGSATRALSRTPSPDYKHMGKGFNFSTYREHTFATPASPPLPPKSPSLAHSPPPPSPSPSPPPIPERSPSRRREPEQVHVQLPPAVTQPQLDETKRSPSLANSPSPAPTPSPSMLKPQPLNIEQRIRDGVSYVQPSPTYQEIDEVIKHLNGSDSDRGVERTPLVMSRAGSQIRSKGPSPEQLISLSPVHDETRSAIVRPTSDPNDLTAPFQYLPADQDYGSSASAAAVFVKENPRLSPSFKPSRRDEDDMSPSRRMGHIAHRESVSDWNDVLSSSDEAKFHARTHFFDNKIGEVIGNVVQMRNRPLEQALAQLSKNFEQFQSQAKNDRHESRRSRRSASDKNSDADDEDDEAQRGASPVKDRKFEKLKHAVLEAVSAQHKAAMPELDQIAQAMTEMRAQLAEQVTKQPANKEIDAVIEQSITRHMRGKSTAVMGSQDAAATDKLKLHISGLESMLKAAEQRAADEEKARQMLEEAVQGNQKLLRAAQEEADQQRESADETVSRLKEFLGAQQDSKERMAMLEEAEEAMQNKILKLSSKTELLEETIEEYRKNNAELKRDLDEVRASRDEVRHALESMQAEKQQLHEAQQSAQDVFETEKHQLQTELQHSVESSRKEMQQMNDDWNKDMADGRAELEERDSTIEKLHLQLNEGSHTQSILKQRLDKIREEMAEAAKTLTKDQSNWRQKEDEHNAKQELLSARLEAEARTRERLELEIDRLEKQEKEAMRAKFLVGQVQAENKHLGSLVNELRSQNHQTQDAAAAAKREVDDVKQRAQTEIQRMSKIMNTEAEQSRSQANIVRQDLQAVIGRLEQELMNTRQEVDTHKQRSQALYQQANQAKEKALAEAADEKTATLHEHRTYHQRVLDEERARHESALAVANDEHARALEAAAEEHRRAVEEVHERHRREIEDMQMEHDRSMRYANSDQKRLLDSAMEDKRMTENYLQGRLSLADEKVAHYGERISHLEERLEIAKSAAQAAAEAAKAAKKEIPASSPVSTHATRPSMSIVGGSNVPDKISPQALRESIAVLQEQLHERETKIESLEQELEPLRDLPQSVREKDLEINFVRELLDVRMEDLQEIIRTLSQPQGFSRQRVRDAVIRLRANLQMEQQEKERQLAQAKNPEATPQPNLSLSSLRDVTASPRNIGLAAAAAWGNWRRSAAQPMSSLAEMAAPAIGGSTTNSTAASGQTPGRSSPSSFLSGLLTPPSTNLKVQTPTPKNRVGMNSRRTSEATSRGGSRPLANYSTPKHQSRPSLARGATEERHMMLSELPQPDTPPGLLNKGNYDQDADEAGSYSLDRYVNDHDEDEHDSQSEEVFEEDNSRMEAEVSHEAIGVVDEPFGPYVGT